MPWASAHAGHHALTRLAVNPLCTNPHAVTATDSDGNKFVLEKVPGSNSTQTVRFRTMYVKGGAHLAASCMRG